MAQGQLAPAKRRHVFVDNSNIFIGAQSFAMPARTMDFTVRLNAVYLASLLDKGAHGAHGVASDGGCRIVAGSKPPAKNCVWMVWDRVGYRVWVCGRDPDTWKEDLVDEVTYKKEYLNLFSSNSHEQAYRPRGCYFKSKGPP